jgi:hypothetical protein
MDDHMQVWSWETEDLDSDWQRWADRVEQLLGHDLDGSFNEDGYSLHGAYEMWKMGLTPEQAYARITQDKQNLSNKRWA